MKTRARGLTLLILVLGAFLALDPSAAWSEERRGSRLLAYYRQVTLRPGGGAVGSAFTLVQVTNGDPTLSTFVRFVLIDAASCTVAGPFSAPLAGGRVIRLDPAAFAPGSAEGVIDLWAVNDRNQPILFNRLTADSTIADLQLPGVMQLAAEILPFDSTAMGDIVPTLLRANFFQLSAIEHRLILARPARRMNLGTAASSSNNVDLIAAAGTVGASTVRTTSCVSIGSLAGVAGGGFSSQFPDGGTVEVSDSSAIGPPVVGWLLHVIPVPFANPGGALSMGIKLHPEMVGPLPQ